ncbi:hypothetical protein F5Y05DRAFT_75630 [Hypoxylon sp. FL0543]|nr:hypothetical protein F5Y05DRAFT_75630 [Hypoxylon sp. FL0543]
MTTFWIMVHILFNVSATCAIRKEVVPIITNLIQRADHSSESLRGGLVQSCLPAEFSFSTKSPAIITLAPQCARQPIPYLWVGSKIILPQRPLFMDPKAFGEDAHVVNPYRFAQNKMPKKQTLPSIWPWNHSM